MFARHDMLLLDAAAVDYARAAAISLNPTISEVHIEQVVHASIPAIVKRQERVSPGLIAVGFSSHLYHKGVRLRVQSVIPLDGIRAHISPFDAISFSHRPGPVRDALEALLHLAEATDVDVGLYGSAALEAITKLPYMTAQSDIDICVRRRGGADLRVFHRATIALAEAYGVRFDIEALCTDGAGVKLAELLSAQKTILCKGLYGPELRPATCHTLPF